jgi:hypothetical protein
MVENAHRTRHLLVIERLIGLALENTQDFLAKFFGRSA